jgi:hypothetical protein
MGFIKKQEGFLDYVENIEVMCINLQLSYWRTTLMFDGGTIDNNEMLSDIENIFDILETKPLL